MEKEDQVLDSVGQKKERLWFIWSFALIASLALVLTIVQQIIVHDDFADKVVQDFSLRFLLNGFSFAVLVFLFHRFFLYAWIALVVLFQTALLYYYSYFGDVPSASVLMNNGNESLDVLDAILATFPWKIFALFLLIGAGQVAVLIVRNRYAVPMKKRLVYSLTCLVGTIALFVGLNRGARSLQPQYLYPLETKISKFGYLPVCAYETYFLMRHPLDRIYEELAVQEQQQQSKILENEFYPTQAPKNIVVIQVESLDYAIMRRKEQGREITPFLNSLADQSLEFRVWAMIQYGSATSDFVMLNGVPPFTGLFNYNIPDAPFRTSLASFLKENEYKTIVTHGVRGTFYNRIEAFKKMNFDELYFRSELLEYEQQNADDLAKWLPKKEWEDLEDWDWLKDHFVLACSRSLLEKNKDHKNFLFIITATSHTPFTGHGKKNIVPNEKNIRDRYFNAINDLDEDLRFFYESLPDDSLVLIYGDHTPRIQCDDYVSDIKNGKHFVPLIISIKGRNISSFQNNESSNGMSLRDAYSYVKKAASAGTSDDSSFIQTASKSDPSTSVR